MASSKLASPARLKLSPEAVPEFEIGTQVNNQHRRMRWCWTDSVALAALALLLMQLVFSSRANSATYDEQYHIANGLAFLHTGDTRLIPEHPPLINAIVALPLLMNRHLVLPLDDSSWQEVDNLAFSNLVLWKLNADGPALLNGARLTIIALTLLLAILVYRWGRQLYGTKAALLALLLLVFDPNILAHGGLATNDIGVTCFATLALYAFWRLLCKPTWGRAIIAGVALGFAQVSKYSALFLIPVIVLTIVFDGLSNRNGETILQRIKGILRPMAIVMLAAAFTIWAVFGFQISNLKGYMVPAKSYLTGLYHFTHMVESGKTSFLLGEYSDTGWWFYFPIAFVVKTPIPTLLLIIGSLLYVYRHKFWKKSLPLLIPVLVYFTFCLVCPFQVGYRHLLPILPLLFIFAGQLAAVSWKFNKLRYAGIFISVGWLAISSWQTFPHYLTFFNELAGGADGGQKILGDSNLDWGQGLISLREYMNREQIESIHLSYLGTADPNAYGITFDPLPSFPYQQWHSETIPDYLLNPPSGIYAISVSNLQGFNFSNHDLYATFRKRQPDAIIGHSIFVYRIIQKE